MLLLWVSKLSVGPGDAGYAACPASPLVAELPAGRGSPIPPPSRQFVVRQPAHRGLHVIRLAPLNGDRPPACGVDAGILRHLWARRTHASGPSPVTSTVCPESGGSGGVSVSWGIGSVPLTQTPGFPGRAFGLPEND